MIATAKQKHERNVIVGLGVRIAILFPAKTFY